MNKITSEIFFVLAHEAYRRDDMNAARKYLMRGLQCLEAARREGAPR